MCEATSICFICSRVENDRKLQKKAFDPKGALRTCPNVIGSLEVKVEPSKIQVYVNSKLGIAPSLSG